MLESTLGNIFSGGSNLCLRHPEMSSSRAVCGMSSYDNIFSIVVRLENLICNKKANKCKAHWLFRL